MYYYRIMNYEESLYGAIYTLINEMSKTALITGSSSGIGFELAKIHAEKSDNLVLVARSKNKLEELKMEQRAAEWNLASEIPERQ